MKTATIITFLILPPTLLAQDVGKRDSLAAPTGAPSEHAPESPTTKRRLLRPASQKAGALIIEEIDPPSPGLTLPATPLPSAAGHLKMRAKGEATEIRLFAPKVILYGPGLSQVRWWINDGNSGSQEYTAWVTRDLSSITACGDLNVGRRRYLLIPSTIQGQVGLGNTAQLPSPAAFKDPGNILLTKGDPANHSALEPLQALLDAYDALGEKIRADAAGNKIEEARLELLTKAPPQKPQDTLLKHWVVKSNLPPLSVMQQNPVGHPTGASSRRNLPTR